MNESRMVGGSRLTGPALAALAWIVGLAMFFPVLWMVLTAFKQERDAFTSPPKFAFKPTFDQFDAVLSGGLQPALLNSVWATAGSTILVIALGLPAAYALRIISRLFTDPVVASRVLDISTFHRRDKPEPARAEEVPA